MPHCHCIVTYAAGATRETVSQHHAADGRHWRLDERRALRSLPAPVNSGKGGPALKQTKLSWSSAGAPEFRQKGVSCPQADKKHIKSETTSNLKKRRERERNLPPQSIEHHTPYTPCTHTVHIYLNHERRRGKRISFDTGNPLPSYLS